MITSHNISSSKRLLMLRMIRLLRISFSISMMIRQLKLRFQYYNLDVISVISKIFKKTL
ncbi:CPXV214 protein [Cowpox virus]|uniref:CPXV214 protein n=3 Tax=Cowpox virus TaxID=10243 RepID=U5TA02_COWPX|nr:CPXV214 protein [Cowpox virus]